MHHNGQDLDLQDMDLHPGEDMAITLHPAPVQRRVAVAEAIRTTARQDSVTVCQDTEDMEDMETIKQATSSSIINMHTIAITMDMDSDRDLDIHLAMANNT